MELNKSNVKPGDMFTVPTTHDGGEIITAKSIIADGIYDYSNNHWAFKTLTPYKKSDIRTFPSGAVRSDDTGRPKPAWISAWAIEALGQHLANNSNDFGAENYLLGIPEEECLQSLIRHYISYKKTGHKGDAVSILFNAVALVHTICIKEDGTYKEKESGGN
jgi:hypothetical protein